MRPKTAVHGVDAAWDQWLEDDFAGELAAGEGGCGWYRQCRTARQPSGKASLLHGKRRLKEDSEATEKSIAGEVVRLIKEAPASSRLASPSPEVGGGGFTAGRRSRRPDVRRWRDVGQKWTAACGRWRCMTPLAGPRRVAMEDIDGGAQQVAEVEFSPEEPASSAPMWRWRAAAIRPSPSAVTRGSSAAEAGSESASSDSGGRSSGGDDEI
uniref:Uncharacterized protein n=1 Tax=Arundo donax TaxID=35708 RepID=A0A0A8ZYW0_ARUDO